MGGGMSMGLGLAGGAMAAVQARSLAMAAWTTLMACTPAAAHRSHSGRTTGPICMEDRPVGSAGPPQPAEHISPVRARRPSMVPASMANIVCRAS